MIDLEINFTQFLLLKSNVKIFFSNIKKNNYNRIYKSNVPNDIESSYIIDKYLWWSEDKLAQEDKEHDVNLETNVKFAKKFINKKIYDYFLSKEFIVDKNFIGDISVWIKDESYQDQEFTKYKKFILKVDFNQFIKGNCLLICYDGESLLFKKNISQLPDIDKDLINKIIYSNKIVNYSDLDAQEKENKQAIYPILNYYIKKSKKIPFSSNISENKYKRYYLEINYFYENNIKGIEITPYLRFLSSGFQKISRINSVPEKSNLLLFGNEKTHYSPYNGMKEYGPLYCDSNKKIKFIFIFHEADKDLANKLFLYMKNGYRSFPGLESFAKVPFLIDKKNSIIFSKSPLEEVKKFFESEFKYEDSIQYFAIYISLIKKDTGNKEEEIIYYKLKEFLLKKSIVSQVVFRENIENPNFNYFLPNISIAILAKIGGIPWRLSRSLQDDLIIGIGAHKFKGRENKFLGSAICFKNDGKFNRFDVFESDDTKSLAIIFKERIELFRKEHSEIKRIVIHYYKQMNWEEEEPIKEVLDDLKLDIPYIILTINDTASRDYIIFDSNFDGKMPQSGTFIKLRNNLFLLCNNTRYSELTGSRIDGFPFPIKIYFKPNKSFKLDYNSERDLIDQVYQFSRMYWKSVRQRNLPVTLEYSEIIAGMIPYFEEKQLPEFAKTTLWFL